MVKNVTFAVTVGINGKLPTLIWGAKYAFNEVIHKGSYCDGNLQWLEIFKFMFSPAQLTIICL